MKSVLARLLSLWRLPGWFPEIAAFRSNRIRNQVRLLALAGLVGIVAGLGAIVFYVATRAVEHYALGTVAGYYPEPRPAGEPAMAWLPTPNTPLRLWLLLLVPTVGGLLSGILVFTLAPEAEGHGTDSVIAAYHYHQGQIRPRVPLGQDNRQRVDARNRWIGRSRGAHRPDRRRLRVRAGQSVAAAARRATRPDGRWHGLRNRRHLPRPLAGTIFAAEVLYRSPEFEPEVIIPTGIASVISYCIFGVYSGWEPLFKIPDLKFTNPWQLGPYLVLALFMAFLAMVYTRTFYGCKRLFDRLPVPRHFRPAVGALLTGLVAVCLYGVASCFVPAPAKPGAGGGPQQVLAVMAFGYSAIQDAVMQDTKVAASILLMIALGKILTTSLTIGSGGSGGVFGPSMVIGGCGSGALGIMFHHFWPHLVVHPASFVIVGMAGFFAAAAKTPFSTLIIVSELTGGYTLLLPSLWVCTLSFILSDKQSIYASQVEGRASFAGPPRQLCPPSPGRGPCQQVSFPRADRGDLALRRSVDPCDRSPERRSVSRIARSRWGQPAPGRRQPGGSPPRVAGASLKPLVLAADLMRSDIQPLTPDDTLDRALELFVENDLMALPVVNDLQSRKVIGILRRFEIASAYLRHVHGPATPTS